MTVITPENAKEFIRTIPIEDFYGVGKVSAEKLKQAGILTGEDLFPLSKEELEKKFGTLGPRDCTCQVRGESNDQLTLHRERKSIGTERTLIKDTTDHGILTGYLEEFAQELERMLKKRSLAARTFTLKLRDSNLIQSLRVLHMRDYFNKKRKSIRLHYNYSKKQWRKAR